MSSAQTTSKYTGMFAGGRKEKSFMVEREITCSSDNSERCWVPHTWSAALQEVGGKREVTTCSSRGSAAH